MYFGADYHPEYWVYPFGGTPENPEARWQEDARLMVDAGINAVRMGEFCWGLCEREEGNYDFSWLKRAMDVMHSNGIKVVLCTPTAAPPIWLAKKYPEILPIDEKGIRLNEGTRRACCLNCDLYWEYSRKIVTAMAEALGSHEALLAWQIDNGIGAHNTESSYNSESRCDWYGWLKAKYETIERLNNLMGLRFWSQVVSDWSQVPVPMYSPAPHNPSLLLDWSRFCSDTIVAFIKMQAEILRKITPSIPLTTNMRMFARNYDYFDVAEAIDFVGLDSYATLKQRSSENACENDMARSLKKEDAKLPDGDCGFWVIEQKAGSVNWLDVNSLIRPGILRLFTYQSISRGASGVFYFYWRQPRFGSEIFYGGVLSHNGSPDNRIYREIQKIGGEIKKLREVIKQTRVVPQTAILVSFDSMQAQKHTPKRNAYFNQRDHIHLFYAALHDRNIPVDFARPGDDLSRYRLVFAPSVHLLSKMEAEALKYYVQNGGTLVGTFDTGVVDEYNIATDSGIPLGLTDVFGLEVEESDMISNTEENHLAFKGAFTTTQLHTARVWCDIIRPNGCQILATYTKEFYAGKPALTLNHFGKGNAVYVATMCNQAFYFDLVAWLRQLCNLFPILKVPETVEVSLRQNENLKLYFLLNHQNSPVRLTFFKPVHDFLTGRTISGNYDLQPYDVLVVDQRAEV